MSPFSKKRAHASISVSKSDGLTTRKVTHSECHFAGREPVRFTDRNWGMSPFFGKRAHDFFDVRNIFFKERNVLFLKSSSLETLISCKRVCLKSSSLETLTSKSLKCHPMEKINFVTKIQLRHENSTKSQKIKEGPQFRFSFISYLGNDRYSVYNLSSMNLTNSETLLKWRVSTLTFSHAGFFSSKINHYGRFRRNYPFFEYISVRE